MSTHGMKEDFYEIANHIVPWFKNELTRYLKNRSINICLLNDLMANIFYGEIYYPASGPHKRIAVEQWHDLIDKLGFEEAKNHGYFVFRKLHIPEEKEDLLRSFLSIVFESILEVCNGRNWAAELNERNGNKGGFLAEWVELNKPVFKRTFWKLWKRHQRENR
jgi:hypothetical protein